MSKLSILFILASLPVALICYYIYKQDRNKEPAKLLLKLFFAGIASCFLVFFLSSIIFEIIPSLGKNVDEMSFFEVLAYSFIGVALIEEFCKWLMVYKIGYSNKEFDESYDAIVYSVFTALGFAFFENLLYVLGKGTIGIGISRGLLAVPGHACDAIFMGYYLYLAKIYNKRGQKDLEKKNIYKSVLVPTILHGIYDFCLFSDITIFIIVFFVFVINLYIISIKKVKEIANISNKPTIRNKFCPNCGTQVEGRFCKYCGTRQE